MPMTISRNATAKSSTFSEKNDMHITAPKNAGKMVTVFSLNSHYDNLYKNLH